MQNADTYRLERRIEQLESRLAGLPRRYTVRGQGHHVDAPRCVGCLGPLESDRVTWVLPRCAVCEPPYVPKEVR